MSGRIFLLSPANCGGDRAGLLLDARAQFPLARELQSEGGAPLGAVFSFLSSLYFRGKLAYGLRFGAPPDGLLGTYIIAPGRGLRPEKERITQTELRALGEVSVDAKNRRFTEPLVRDARALATVAGAGCDIVLLGSIATGKYVDPLLEVLGESLLFPSDFVGRGDMSRGGLLLRRAREGAELTYESIRGASRRGRRAPRIAELGASSAPGGPPASSPVVHPPKRG